MKKRVVLYGLLSCFVLFILAGVYFNSLLSTVVVRALDNLYGLRLEYKEMRVDWMPQWVSIRGARLLDSSAGDTVLANWDVLQLNVPLFPALRGGLQLRDFHAGTVRVELRRLASGELNWTGALRRILPSAAPPVTTSSMQPSPELVAQMPTDAVSSSTAVQAATKTQSPAGATTPGASTSAVSATSAVALPRSTPPTAPRPNVNPPRASTGRIGNESWPGIDMQNLQINYYTDENSDTPIAIHLDHFTFYPSEYRFDMVGMEWTGAPRPLPFLSIGQVGISQPPGQTLAVTASQVNLDARETAPGAYDFTDLGNRWLAVFRELKTTVAAGRASTGESVQIGSLHLDNVSINVVPATGTVYSPGALEFTANSVDYSVLRGEITLNSVVMQEAGQSALRLQRLRFSGDFRNAFSLAGVELEGMTLDIREDETGGLNVERAIARIRNLLHAILPPRTKTAQGSPPPLREASLEDTQVVLHAPNRPSQKLTIKALHLDGDRREGRVESFQTSILEERESIMISLPQLNAKASPGDGWRSWDEVTCDRPMAAFEFRPEGWRLVQSASQWLVAVDKIQRALEIAPSVKPDTPFAVKQFNLVNGDVSIAEKRLDEPMNYRFQQVSWRGGPFRFGVDDNTLSPFQAQAQLVSPSRGRLEMQGSVSPRFHPLNLNSSIDLNIDNLTAFELFYRNSLPVTIERSGFRLAGTLAIQNNHVISQFDIYLLQPIFSVAKTELPTQVDSLAAVTALNGLKDAQGVIVFRNNRVEGDINNPRFLFGASVSEIFAKNVWNRTLTVLKLPLDVVGKGADVLLKGAGFVKKLFGQ